eukprot:m.70486 g.70486  ORF g.70486 m.70486 type:complete len:486 (-) comp14302_c1_seq1:444-1901(-)
MAAGVLLPLLLAVACMALADNPAPDAYVYQQRFDHFSVSDNRTFAQRYFVYDKAYKPGVGPIFFCPGGEADAMSGYNHNGFMFELGIPLNALFLFPEHRFYGQSLPMGPTDSYLPGNVDKLTISQALADYADILNYVKQKWNVPEGTPVIAFGGSYPGELAAFMRLQFPNLVNGALASSAPIRYHQGITPPVASGAFFQVATDAFARSNPSCEQYARMAFQELFALFNKGSAGLQAIAEDLGLCQPINGTLADFRKLMLWAENAFAILGMENYPYATGGFPASPMDVACAAQLSTAGVGRATQGLGLALNVAYNLSSAPVPCHDLDQEFLECADITGCGSPGPDAYSWDYQSCTEIVSNIDTNGVTDMFLPFPYDWPALVKYCKNRWNVTPDPLKIPTMYNITAESASNIIFTNGLLDPWWPGGVLSDLSPTLRAFQIEGGAHHLDLRGSDPADPPSVVLVREASKGIILGWIAESKLAQQQKSL